MDDAEIGPGSEAGGAARARNEGGGETVVPTEDEDRTPNYPPVPYPQRTLSPSIPQQDYQTVFPLSLPVHFLHEQMQLGRLSRQASMGELNADGERKEGGVNGVNGHGHGYG